MITRRNPYTSNHFLRGAFDGICRAFDDRHHNLFSKDSDDGSLQPHRMNGFASPFWRGYFGEMASGIVQGTFAFAVYRAGQACRRSTPLEFKHTGKIGEAGRVAHQVRKAALEAQRRSITTTK